MCCEIYCASNDRNAPYIVTKNFIKRCITNLIGSIKRIHAAKLLPLAKHA